MGKFLGQLQERIKRWTKPVESAVLTGQITEQQKDSASGEWKYVLKGQTLEEENIFCCRKDQPRQ